MKIRFKINQSGVQAAQAWREAIETEDIGFDDMGRASLLYPSSEGIMREGGGQTPRLQGPGLIQWRGLRLQSEEVGGPVWITCWGAYTYTLLNPDSYESAEIEYSGPRKGFLRQNLLPRFEGVQVLTAEGNFGESGSLKEWTLKVYDVFVRPAIRHAREHLEGRVGRSAAEILLRNSNEVKDDFQTTFDLVRVNLSGWAPWSTSCDVKIFTGYVTREDAVIIEGLRNLESADREAAQRELYETIERLYQERS